ncbi:phosphotransferase enzyme family protein [Plantactinospora sp. CA-290183]|uniref:phosphotransferase enzyme family protein n=1 Tax=Plantactinospora sp. CA-290183 TaxID=3240006 RepID=UPI003D911B75
MDAVRTELPELLLHRWGIAEAEVAELSGGMNSRTWLVRGRSGRWVAKLVPHDRGDALRAGLRLAAVVESAGIETGAPRPTLDGAVVVGIRQGWLALLAWVAGTPLRGDPGAQPLIGETLARAHTALAGVRAQGLAAWHWVDPTAPHLDVEPWVRDAVSAGVRQWESIAGLPHTWGGLHGDPAPDAFRFRATDRRCGLIDWGSAVYGPLLYDLASAVMYVGGPEAAGALIDSYRASGPLGGQEIEVGLSRMVRFRWAVQADYFARRLRAGDLTGIDDAAENLTGLRDARRHLPPL